MCDFDQVLESDGDEGEAGRAEEGGDDVRGNDGAGRRREEEGEVGDRDEGDEELDG